MDFGLTQCVLYIDTLLIDCGCTFVRIALYVWTIDGHLHTILSVSSCRCWRCCCCRRSRRHRMWQINIAMLPNQLNLSANGKSKFQTEKQLRRWFFAIVSVWIESFIATNWWKKWFQSLSLLHDSIFSLTGLCCPAFEFKRLICFLFFVVFVFFGGKMEFKFNRSFCNLYQ